LSHTEVFSTLLTAAPVTEMLEEIYIGRKKRCKRTEVIRKIEKKVRQKEEEKEMEKQGDGKNSGRKKRGERHLENRKNGRKENICNKANDRRGR